MSKQYASTKNTANINRFDLEINALLNRLHSGCRFIDFDELVSAEGGGGASSKDAYNLLRNASCPDEVHAELGRGLAHSYIESLLQVMKSKSVPSLLNDKDAFHQAVVERGERILHSLCCGEVTSSPNSSDGESGRWRHHQSSTRLNYVSTACAYFHSLYSYCAANSFNDDSIRMEISNTVAITIFLRKEWQKWCVICEELVLQTPNHKGGGGHVLNACLKSYSCICYMHHGTSDDNGIEGSGIARVYEALMHQPSRKYLIRTCIDRAFHVMKQTTADNVEGEAADSLIAMISPLFYSCILVARRSGKTSDHYQAERQLLLHEILKNCSIALLHDRDVTANSKIVNMVRYLTSSLTSYLTQSVYATFFTESLQLVDIIEFSYGWLSGICEIIQSILVLAEYDSGKNHIPAISSSMERIVSILLPQFTVTLGTADAAIVLDMTPIYSTINSCFSFLPQNNVLPFANATVALRLGALALTLTDDDEVTLMIDMIWSIMKCLENSCDCASDELLIGGILNALGCIYQCRPACFDRATRLYELGELLLRRARCQKDYRGERKQETRGQHMIDTLCLSMIDGDDFSTLLDIIAASISMSPSDSFTSWQRRPLLFTDQCAGVLIGLSFLHTSVKSPEASKVESGHAITFLRSLLQAYPRVASRVVPSVIDTVQACLTISTHQTNAALIESLEFLSSKCIVSDAHGAHLAWAFLSPLVTEEMPTAVRSTVIRLLPDMCSGNRRLFRRVIGIVGKSMLAQDPIIRLAATAALSEMAKLDLIRDVENIVGLIQSRLFDEEPAVVYYALEVLRYLVVNEELDFDLVVRVLEKRLVIDLSNVSTIVHLDMLALEELVVLMGHGGLDENDNENGRDEIGPTVSLQTIRAVALLVELALLPHLSIKRDIGQDNEVEILAKLRIHRAIYCSLAGYSAHILGLDAESIRSWDGIAPSANESDGLNSELKRYLNLKDIALNGLDCATKLFAKGGSINNDNGVVQDFLESAASICKTLLHFEEDVHGSFLFRGRHSCSRDSETSFKTEAEKNRLPKSVISSLPTETYIKENFQSDPRSATAVAMLYSLGLSDDASRASMEIDDILLQISECLGDVINEPFEPIFRTIQICSLIHGMSTLWKYIQCTGDSVKVELLNQVITHLDEWSEIHGDSALVAMSAFFLAVDDSAHQYCSGLVRIQQTIVDSEDNHLFQSDDTKMMCLGIIAARLCRDLDSRVNEIISSIERSLLHSRQNYFGALFGLSMIMKNLSGNEYDTDSSATWQKQHAVRIMHVLLSTFNTCLAHECEDLNKIRSSIESYNATNDICQSCSDLESLCIRDGSALQLKSVLLAIGSSFPALRSISSDLLRCVFTLVDKLPWGTGKGFVLHAAYKNAIESEVLTRNDLSHAISSTVEFVQDAGVGAGIGDALLSLSLLCQIYPGNVQKELEVVVVKSHEILKNNRAQVAGDDKLLSILAGCAIIGELPGLSLYTPTIHTSAKKSIVASYTQLLVDIASFQDLDQKVKDTSMIGLGMLCAMRSSGNQARASSFENKFHRVQTKEGTMMQAIIREIDETYSYLCKSPSRYHAKRPVFVKKLCALFSTLERIALPGSFVSVIEHTLNVPIMSNEEELKVSSIKLLVSQLESRRRIGFDGRGFVDLSTRLSKMPPNELNALVSSATPIMMTSLPNLIYQLPTSIAEDIVPNLWAICLYEIMESTRSSSATEFLRGIQRIMGSMSDRSDIKHVQNKTLSPALLRTIRKFIVVEVFSDLCTDSMQDKRSGNVWTSYLQCLQHTPDAIVEIESLNCDISWANVFGMSTISMVTSKSARRVESWISLQATKDVIMVNHRLLLLSIISIAMQPRHETEVKESIISHFEVMLVKGIDTMSIYIVAAKIAFWWENRLNQVHGVDVPLHRVSNMSSFYVNGKLSGGAKLLTPKMLVVLFDAFVVDLPPKLAVLCNMWKISDDISNRASRILKTAGSNEASGIRSSDHLAHAMACMNEIVHLLSEANFSTRNSQRIIPVTYSRANK